MIEPIIKTLIDGATLTTANTRIITSTGVFTDTQTITIGGVVFTTVTALSVGPAVAGEVLIGASAAATIVNLAAAINAPETTTSTFTALSASDANIIRNILKLSAVATSATLLTVTAGTRYPFSVSETQTNAAWSTAETSNAIGSGTGGKMSMQFIASAISSGNGVFTVQVSNDNTNWIAFSRLNSNVTNTNSQTDTRVASVTLSSNTNGVVTMPTSDVFGFLRVICTITTDGAYSAKVLTV